MADRPIIFSAPMVRALLDGRKTQTRRVAKIKWEDGANPDFSGWRSEQVGPSHWQIIGGMGVGANIATPYAPGDRLYVREAHKLIDRHCDYRADWPEATQHLFRWRPSIHMPRWASRLTLTVTDVRVQRLQEISEADAVAEGLETQPSPLGISSYYCFGQIAYSRAKPAFSALWNSLHGPGAWDANPWVVALTFTVRHGNIDMLGDK